LLFFYPLDFTFVCPTEICAFNDRAEEFAKLHCQVVGISIDSKYSHLAWTQQPRNKGGLGETSIPLVEDLTKSISRAYGVLHEADGVAFRGLFIINKEGIIRHVQINDMPIGRSVDESLRLLQAIQFHEEHGEVCPSDWKPGKASMKDNPVDAQKYFGTLGDETPSKKRKGN